MTNKCFPFEGSEVHYSVTGKGTPVVLLHGFGEDSTIWNNQVADLQQHCMLILPDIPGSGKSAMLQKYEVSMGDYGGCIKALLDVEAISKCVLFGHSMGGYITLEFAEKYPERLTAFGLVHSTAFADSEEKKATRRKGIEMMNEYGAYPFLKNTIPNLFSTKFKQEQAEKVNALIEKWNLFTKEALIQYYNAMIHRPDRTHVLRDSKVPVLFIVGTEDVAAPLNDLLQQVHLPKIAHIHIIEGVGHMSMLEAPAQLSEYLLAMIAEA